MFEYDTINDSVQDYIDTQYLIATLDEATADQVNDALDGILIILDFFFTKILTKPVKE